MVPKFQDTRNPNAILLQNMASIPQQNQEQATSKEIVLKLYVVDENSSHPGGNRTDDQCKDHICTIPIVRLAYVDRLGPICNIPAQ